MKRIVNILLLVFSFQCILAQPFSIGSYNDTYTDASRSKAIETFVFYPATSTGSNAPIATGEFPVVVFGHGFATTYAAYSNIWEFLVPQGYIVALPNTETQLGTVPHDDFGADIAYIADVIQGLNADASSIFFNKVYPTTAVMGHSMGGGCAILAAENNPDITTTITMGAVDTDPSAATAGANVSAPSLVIAGSGDCIAPQGSGPTPLPFDIYNGIAASCKGYFEITDGTHCNFTNGDGAIPFVSPAFNCIFGELTCASGSLSLADQHAQYEAAVLPWLDFWLKNDCARWGDFQTLIGSPSGFTYQSPDPTCGVTPPVAAISPSTSSVCTGGTTTLTASGGVNYAWDNAATLNNEFAAAPIASPTMNTTYTVTVTDAFGCEDTEAVNITVASCPSVIQVKAVLEGARISAGLMKTTLLTDGILPLSNPYSGMPWMHAGGEMVAAQANIPANAVDWVLIEAYDASNALIEAHAGFLLSNGDVVDVDGVTAGLNFANLAINASYNIVFRHRNHLDIISAAPVTISATTIVDFTDLTQVLSSGSTPMLKDLGGSEYVVYAGDIDGDGRLLVNDFNDYYAQSSSLNQYKSGDCSLDTHVTITDFNLYQPNSGIIGESLITY